MRDGRKVQLLEVFKPEVLGTWAVETAGVLDQRGTPSWGLCPLRTSCVNEKQRQLKSALFIANKAHSWGFSKYRIELGQSQESS